LDDLLHNAPSETIVGGARRDPIFNRLARLLERAASQFAAVNPSRRELNILAYVNHDPASRYADLHETLTGYFLASDGSTHPTVRRIAEDWIGEAKRRVDVFLWFEGANMWGLINDADPMRVRRVCALFGFDQDKIK
jgi:hypothetical protein